MVVDSLTEQFGIRSLEFSPEFGFKLNGKKIFLQGNANHHDLGALGAASYDRAIERMMLQLKSCLLYTSPMKLSVLFLICSLSMTYAAESYAQKTMISLEVRLSLIHISQLLFVRYLFQKDKGIHW